MAEHGEPVCSAAKHSMHGKAVPEKLGTSKHTITSVLFSGRSADSPSIVAADEDNWRTKSAGKVDGCMEVSF